MRSARFSPGHARPFVAVVATLLAIIALVGLQAPAQSTPAVGHDRVVSSVPPVTPSVNDGEVDNMVQIGDVMVVGGSFTSVTEVGSTTPVTRNRVFAFSVSTGKLITGFAPTVNGQVNEVIAGPSATTVYLGGAFTTVNGKTQSHVTLLNLSDGSIASTWTKLSGSNGLVQSMELRNGHLFIGGFFSTVGGVAHAGLASLDPNTGKADTYVNNQLSVHHNDSGSGAVAPIGVRDLDINAAGTRMVVIGNFKKVDGLSRDQLVMITLPTTGSTTVTPDWATTRYSPYCAKSAFDSYVRGVAFSPDGSYFVVTATGAYSAGTLCDAASRFETGVSSTAVQPTWVDYTGGDTLWSVAVTEKAVYVGGHERWMNNSLASDRAGGGAVPRPGLAALSTQSGLPLAWNPGRNPRGAAVYALYATTTGLWIGSDTDYIGNHRYKRPRLAFFPLASGAPEQSDATVSLANDTVYLGSSTAGTADDLRTVKFDGSSVPGAAVPSTTSGVPWSTTRGAFYAGGRVYYGKSTNTFAYRTLNTDGTFGAEVLVDPYHDPVWAGVDTGSNNTYDGVPPALYGQMSTVNGMAYSAGKLYYTRGTDTNLHWRWFNADSGIIGSDEFTASGGRSWANTGGMFAAGGKLYFVNRSNGSLNSITLTSAGPTGTSSVVNSTTDWRARSLFLAPTPVIANKAPTASYSQTCTALECDFNAGASNDPDGTIASYAWDFGDGSTGTGSTIHHGFGGNGTYPVKLTVTDNLGAPGTTTTNVAVTGGTTTDPISFVGGSGKGANTQSVVVPLPSGTQAGDTLVMTGAESLATAADAPAGWTKIGDQTSTSQLRSTVWTHTVAAGDPASVTVTMDAVHKATFAVAAYRGVAAKALTVAFNTEGSTASHTTPTMSGVAAGSRVVSVWTDKGSSAGSNAAWSVPAGQNLRIGTYLSGASSPSVGMADPGGAEGGTVGGVTATATTAGTRALNWTIVLPAS